VIRDRGGPPGGSIADPPIARALFGETRWAWVWVVPRLYVGAAWGEAGWAKWHSPAWTGTDAGTALSRFVTEALAKTGGRHPDVPWWYARFLAQLVQPYPRFWSYLISTGAPVPAAPRRRPAWPAPRGEWERALPTGERTLTNGHNAAPDDADRCDRRVGLWPRERPPPLRSETQRSRRAPRARG